MGSEELHGFGEAEERRAMFVMELDMAASTMAAEAEAEGRSPHLQAMLTTLSTPGDLDGLRGHLRRLTAVYADKTNEVDDDVERTVGLELEIWDAFGHGEDDTKLPADWRAAVQDYRLIAESESVERDAADSAVLQEIIDEALTGAWRTDEGFGDSWEVLTDEFPEDY